jgi:hypothetical protein
MVFGDRSLIPEVLELAFQRSGVTDISSIYRSPSTVAEKQIFGVL